MILAGNFAGKSPPNGIYEWSPSLAKAGGTVSYWKKRKAMAAAGRGGNRGGLILETIVLGIRDEGNNDMVYIK